MDVLRDWGIHPSGVIGHFSGEVAATYAAGLVNAPQALLAAFFRGFVVNRLKSRGAMMATGISIDDANSMIQESGLEEIRVACVNSPSSVTISGSMSDVKVFESELQTRGLFNRMLETDGRAYHSHMMAEIGNLYEELVRPYLQTNGSKPQVKMFSCVAFTAGNIKPIGGGTNMATYFRENLEQPVQFNAAMETLLESQNYHLIEIGPHAALKSPIQQIRSNTGLNETTHPYTPTLNRNENANFLFLKVAGRFHIHGHALKWLTVNNLTSYSSPPFLAFPPYP